MKNKIVAIKLKDLCYYDDDFKYDTIYVEKGKDFEEKYKEFVNICKNWEDFEEVYEYIANNFTRIDIEEREIMV